MSSITFNLPDDKEPAFSELCRHAGLSVADALDAFIDATLAQGKIPLGIAGDPFYSPANAAALGAGVREADAGVYAARAGAGDFDDLIAGL